MRKVLLALAAIAAGLFPSLAAAAPPLEVYGKLPGLEMAVISPSGERSALIGVVQDKRRLLVIEDGKAVMAADIGERKVRDIRWAGEDKVLVFGSATYALGPMFVNLKYEIEDATVIDLKTKAATPLLSKGPAGNGVWGTYAITEEEGRWYGYFGAITLGRSKDGSFHWKDGHPDLYRVDLSSGRERRKQARRDCGER
ncbi:MAG TPA: hypothetical protein VD906_13365, partial [Caulobacteraceae bacterium]|nr:hypothetical protein [Caulobacteraceae bacterium]